MILVAMYKHEGGRNREGGRLRSAWWKDMMGVRKGVWLVVGS